MLGRMGVYSQETSGQAARAWLGVRGSHGGTLALAYKPMPVPAGQCQGRIEQVELEKKRRAWH